MSVAGVVTSLPPVYAFCCAPLKMLKVSVLGSRLFSMNGLVTQSFAVVYEKRMERSSNCAVDETFWVAAAALLFSNTSYYDNLFADKGLQSQTSVQKVLLLVLETIFQDCCLQLLISEMGSVQSAGSLMPMPTGSC